MMSLWCPREQFTELVLITTKCIKFPGFIYLASAHPAGCACVLKKISQNLMYLVDITSTIHTLHKKIYAIYMERSGNIKNEIRSIGRVSTKIETYIAYVVAALLAGYASYKVIRPLEPGVDEVEEKTNITFAYVLAMYIPKKLHPNLKPLVEACLMNDIGFDFIDSWVDDPAFSLTTVMLVRRSDNGCVQVVVSDNAMRTDVIEAKGSSWTMKGRKWTCIEDFVAFVKDDF